MEAFYERLIRVWSCCFLFMVASSHALPSTPSTKYSSPSTFQINSTNEANFENRTVLTPASVVNHDHLYDGVDCERCDVSYCYSNGGCCQSAHYKFCTCLANYSGERCEWIYLESKDRRVIFTLGASLATLFTILLALLLLIFVILYVLKKGKSQHTSNMPQYGVLDRELLYVQGELGKLTGKDKTCGKMRLSTMIEATARAALITYPDLVSTLEETNISTPNIIGPSRNTRRQSEPCIGILSRDDPFRVERSTAVFFYNKPGKVRYAKPNLRKLLSF